jgi:hypothetical protein
MKGGISMNEKGNHSNVPSRYVQGQTQLSKSDIFGVLQNDRRRCILELLYKQEKLSIRSLSEEIARMESGAEEPNSSIRKSIYISLLQTHIPKMESLNLIIYSREKDSVELLPAARDFDFYIETVKKGDIPWSQFYLGLSTLAVVGSFAILTELVKWITSYQWMLFISIIFLASSLAHMHQVCKRKE